MLIIVRPGAAAFQAVSLLAVSAALIYALVMISARWIDKRDNFRTMMLYMTLFPALFSAFVIFGEWPQPRASDVLLFLGMTVAGTVGLGMISHAFRTGPASVVAPFDYTAVIWATFVGWLVWSEIPDLCTYVGAAVIIASGI